MSARHIHFLTSLKQALASPALDAVGDAALRVQLQVAQRILARLLVDESHVLQLASEALAELTAQAEGIQVLFERQGTKSDAIVRLRQLASTGQPPRFEEVLNIARDMQLQLLEIPGDEAREKRRSLVAMENRFSRNLVAAFDQWLAPIPGAASSAVNTREIDAAAFNAFLARAFPAEKGLRLAGYSFISGGHSKFTAKVELTGGQSIPSTVILRADAGGTFGGVSVVDEFRLLQVLHRNGVKVPKPLALDESGSAFGGRMMLVEAMPGDTIGHMFMLPPPNPALARDIATQLALLHRIPAAEFGLQIDSAERTNQEKAALWLDESYAAFKAINRPSPVFEAAFHWLRKNIGLNDGARSVVHGDYGLNNILILDGRVSTILDWEFAHIGNPVYDLGYFYFMAEALGSWSDFYDAYRAAGGFEPTQAQLDYAVLFAATRLGVMVCQSEAAFEAGAIKGLVAAASNTAFHEVSIQRIAGVLERVL